MKPAKPRTASTKQRKRKSADEAGEEQKGEEAERKEKAKPPPKKIKRAQSLGAIEDIDPATRLSDEQEIALSSMTVDALKQRLKDNNQIQRGTNTPSQHDDPKHSPF